MRVVVLSLELLRLVNTGSSIMSPIKYGAKEMCKDILLGLEQDFLWESDIWIEPGSIDTKVKKKWGTFYIKLHE